MTPVDMIDALIKHGPWVAWGITGYAISYVLWRALATNTAKLCALVEKSVDGNLRQAESGNRVAVAVETVIRDRLR